MWYELYFSFYRLEVVDVNRGEGAYKIWDKFCVRTSD